MMIEAVSMVIVQLPTVQDIEHRMAETQETCFSVSSGNREAAGPLLMTILHSLL
jgi:hypothetical protein